MKMYHANKGTFTKKSIDQMGSQVLIEAVQVIRVGGVVAVPTDTVYGLIADVSNPDAVRRIFAIKGRVPEKALPVFVRDIAMARRFAYISDAKAEFLEKMWPGQVTVVFQHKEKLPKVLTGGHTTLGMRMPKHPLLIALLEKLGVPLAETSANPSGKPAARSAARVKEYFRDAEHQPDLLIDGGETGRSPSAVIDFTGIEPLVLRSGATTKGQFDRLLKSVR